jgi:hypothetical protein
VGASWAPHMGDCFLSTVPAMQVQCETAGGSRAGAVACCDQAVAGLTVEGVRLAWVDRDLMIASKSKPSLEANIPSIPNFMPSLHHHTPPAVNATGEIQDPPPNFWVPLPVLSFGPFTPSAATYASGCQLAGATPGDAWPAGMCSLYALEGDVPPGGAVTDTSPASAGGSNWVQRL